jgi:hypothetical protein
MRAARLSARVSVFGLAIAWALARPGHAQVPGAPAEVRITTLPSVVYTSTQETFFEPASNPPNGHMSSQNVTWMFHLVLESTDRRPLRVEEVEATFSANGATLWRQSYSRPYLERMEWVKGKYSLTTEHYLDRFMFGGEERATPDLSPGGAVSWLRIAFAQPWFARADRVDMRLRMSDPSGREHAVAHVVPLLSRPQRARLRLPFTGTWLVVKGSDLAPITHRWTGLNGLTTFGWDFMKLGEDGALYKGRRRQPADRHSFGATALAPADGRVVHMRNDIDDYGGSPPRAVLEKDGDVFSGNLVVLDHGHQEFTLISHLEKGSVAVKVGEYVKEGHALGRVGEQGILHMNVMDGGEWLKANGLPALISDFDRVLPAGAAQPIPLGNPVTGWMVRSRESRPISAHPF